MHDSNRRVIGVVLDRDLRLAVGAQVGQRPVLADRRQTLGQSLGNRDRQGHQHVGVVTGVSEHQALIAGALSVQLVGAVIAALLIGIVDALGDIGRLRADGDLNATGVAVEALLG